MPLEELEKLKTLKVSFYSGAAQFVSEHVVRLPKESTMHDVLEALKGQLGPAFATKRLRMTEVLQSKVYKVREGMKTGGWPLPAS
jgi:hypothetical protein